MPNSSPVGNLGLMIEACYLKSWWGGEGWREMASLELIPTSSVDVVGHFVASDLLILEGKKYMGPACGR